MSAHELLIEIDRHGNVRVTTEGMKGAECLRYRDLLEEAVGKVQEVELTHGYYEPDPTVCIEPTTRLQS